MDRAGLQGAEEEAGAAGEAVRIRNEMEQGGRVMTSEPPCARRPGGIGSTGPEALP